MGAGIEAEWASPNRGMHTHAERWQHSPGVVLRAVHLADMRMGQKWAHVRVGGDLMIRGGVDRIRCKARDKRGTIGVGFSVGHVWFKLPSMHGRQTAHLETSREQVFIILRSICKS